MEPAATPIFMYSKIVKANEPNELNESKIINKKEYELKYENNIYNFQIQIDSNYIYFKIIQNKDEDIAPTFYKNKFDLKTITNMLKLYPDIYNDLNKVISLLNDCYNRNKIKLSMKEKDVNIIITIINGNIEINCPINLIETKTGIDDKFEIIINDIKLLKKNINNSANNKILEIEKAIKDMQILINAKLDENENKIKELSSNFEKSENNIKILQEEFFEIKKYLKEFNKLNYHQENNSNKNYKNYIINKKESIHLDGIPNTNKENLIVPSINDNDNNNNKIKIDNENIIEKKESKEYFNNDIDIISDNFEINSLIENQKNQQNSVNNTKLCDNNNVQENIIIHSFDNDIKEEYNTPKRKINVPKKFNKHETMSYDYYRSNYNSFIITTPSNKKEEDLITNQDLNNNCLIKNYDSENNNKEIRKESYYSVKPTISDNSSDDSSDFDNRRSKIIFKSQKWKNKHSKRKLACISEEIDAPIFSVKNIPKFRIFKGFKSFQTSKGNK